MSKVVMHARCRQIGEPGQVSPVSAVSIETLADLMVNAYQGTIDWEEGDDASVAAAEIRATIAGKYGNFIPGASGVMLDEQQNPVSAVFVANFEGRATILFAFTAKAVARRGLASMLIRNAAFQLSELGFDEVSLFVTDDNPARDLYRRLGFAEA